MQPNIIGAYITVNYVYPPPTTPPGGSDLDPPDLWRNVGGGDGGVISNLIFLRISLINFFS